MHTPGYAQSHEHVAAFYQTDRFLIERVSAFIGEGLSAGEHTIVLATLPHWNAIAARLEVAGINYGSATTEGRLILIDAEHVLDSITVDEGISVDKFRSILAPLTTPGQTRRIYGEVVSLLVQRGDVESALAIEALGHELARELQLRVWCGYNLSSRRPLTSDDVSRIETLHTRSFFEDGQEAEAPQDHSPVHAVRFYEDRDALALLVARFISEGFLSGLPAVVIATPDHRRAILDALSQRYFDVDRLQEAGDLIMVDARDTLRSFMVDGTPDPVRFRNRLVPIIEQACRGRADCVIRAYGEMVDVLWQEGQTAAAIRLETLWNQLAQTHAFALLCGYSMGHFYKSASREDICRQHTHVLSGTNSFPLLQ